MFKNERNVHENFKTKFSDLKMYMHFRNSKKVHSFKKWSLIQKNRQNQNMLVNYKDCWKFWKKSSIQKMFMSSQTMFKNSKNIHDL